MFSISFPTFYYGTDGCIDPLLMCLLVIRAYLIFKGKWLYFALILVLGSLVKEVIVLLLPVSLAFLLEDRKPWKLKLTIFLLACLIPAIFVRFLFRESGSYYWYPSIERLMSNIRVRALVSVVLSFGLPGFLSLFFGVHYKKLKKFIDRKQLIPLLTGILFSLLLVMYSMVSAYTDGRFIWPLSIYTIPLSLWFLQQLSDQDLKAFGT
jgi:hypothetical protein